jgi:citrate synthase
MATLQDILMEKLPAYRERTQKLIKDHGDEVISQVTVKQAFGGMRGVKGMVCDTSVVNPDEGLSVRGHPLLDIGHLWPEEMFFLLLTGEMPDDDAKAALQSELDRRSQVPDYVWKAITAMPKDTCPMAMLATSILVMDSESVFRKWYERGMKREEYWLAMIGDGLNIIAKLPVLAAGIYRLRYDHGSVMHWTHGLDYAANYSNMLGVADPAGYFAKLMRLYLNIHMDHEGGNVSANTCHTVGSALSDAYYSVSAGINGLAGPLHGLANQEVISWILQLMDRFGGVPSESDLEGFAFETLRSGRVIPGYGHAVLRCVDPRYTILHQFGEEFLPGDPLFKTVDRIFNVVPRVLQEYSNERVAAGKNPIANCWPNVDAISGALLYHFGISEFKYYTVLFSVSRVMGMIAQLILNRAIHSPITRPKSVSSEWILSQVKGAGK